MTQNETTPAKEGTNPAELYSFLRQQLSNAAAFTGFASEDTHLIATHPEYNKADHHDALTSLVCSGVISDYRYIDSVPHSTVIAIRT